MPELPEVETIKNTLREMLIHRKIFSAQVLYPSIIEYPDVDTFLKKIQNQTILDIQRRGKWLLFELDDYYLLSHLRMEGRYLFRNKDLPILQHEHVVFDLGDEHLRYQDTRKFGRMHLLLKEDLYKRKPLSELGLEPMDEKLTSGYLKQKYFKKRIPIKTVLLDQNIVVGIGNIYADEILFLSKISPLKPAVDLSLEELEKIIYYTRDVLSKAIELGGTTIRSYEVKEGVHGLFQNELYVHGKDGENCPICKNALVRIRIGGRGTTYCKNCQRL